MGKTKRHSWNAFSYPDVDVIEGRRLDLNENLGRFWRGSGNRFNDQSINVAVLFD
jgi:hypothetical protein